MEATAGSFSRECTKYTAPLPMRYTAPASCTPQLCQDLSLSTIAESVLSCKSWSQQKMRPQRIYVPFKDHTCKLRHQPLCHDCHHLYQKGLACAVTYLLEGPGQFPAG